MTTWQPPMSTPLRLPPGHGIAPYTMMSPVNAFLPESLNRKTDRLHHRQGGRTHLFLVPQNTKGEYRGNGALQVALVVKNPPAKAENVRDMGWILGSGRSPEVGNDNPLQDSCLKNPTEEPGGLQSTESQQVGHN